MKVLMAVQDYPPDFVGGVERTVEALCESLVGFGHDVMVFAGSGDRPREKTVERCNRSGVNIIRVKRSSTYTNPVDVHDPDVELEFDALVSRFSPDVLHVHHWFQTSSDLVWLAARRGIPAVVSLHDQWATCPLFFRMPEPEGAFCREPAGEEACLPCLSRHRPMEAVELQHSFRMRAASVASELELARAILVSSASHARHLAHLGAWPLTLAERVRIRPIGAADLPALPEPSVTGDLVVAHWGNLSSLKGTDILVKALSRAATGRQWTARILGGTSDPSFQGSLRDAAGDAVSLDLRPAYRVADLPRELEGVHLAAFPSLAEETHSIVLDEALQLGLPVIVSDRGALPERIGGRGVVVPAGDVQALAAALDSMADAGVRARHRAASPGPVARPRDYAEAVLEVYADAVREGAPVDHLGRDLARVRLAHRNARLGEIAAYLVQVDAERRRLEQTLAERSVADAARDETSCENGATLDGSSERELE
ncbi:MAG TPA: glycosyltransferase [Planctomycetes bacterium]|nr:glycosyltransferase [Planctomycetota bacterium]